MNLSLEITLVREQHPIIGQSPKRENQTTLGGLTHVHMDTIVAEQQSHGRKIRETCRKSCDCLEKKVQVRISGYSARLYLFRGASGTESNLHNLDLGILSWVTSNPSCHQLS